jgi:uncharacterized protein
VIANYTKEVVYTSQKDKWRNRTIMNMENCLKCKYALICAGGCVGRLAASGKNIYNSSCENFNNIFATMVNVHYKKSLKQ